MQTASDDQQAAMTNTFSYWLWVPGIETPYGRMAAINKFRKLQITVTPRGIEGHSVEGTELPIDWAEEVTVLRIARHMLGLFSVAKRQSLAIPWKVAADPEFRAAISRCAPADHPLSAWLSNPAEQKEFNTMSPIPDVAGFAVGFVTSVTIALLSGTWFTIDPNQWLLPVVVAFFFMMMLGTVLNKKRMGERWNNQHWFERSTTSLMHFIYGLVLSTIAYSALVLVVTAK